MNIIVSEMENSIDRRHVSNIQTVYSMLKDSKSNSKRRDLYYGLTCVVSDCSDEDTVPSFHKFHIEIANIGS